MPFERVSTEGLVPLPFDKTLTTPGTPEDLLLIPAGLIGVSLFLAVDTRDSRIGFDSTAVATSLLVAVGEVYTEDKVTIRSRISFREAASGRPHVHGIVWARRK